MSASPNKAELESWCLGWSGAAWRTAHDTMEAAGGGFAAWISYVWSPRAAFLMGAPLMVLNAFMGAHPILRLFTSIGPGMVSGATAIAVDRKLQQGNVARRAAKAA